MQQIFSIKIIIKNKFLSTSLIMFHIYHTDDSIYFLFLCSLKVAILRYFPCCCLWNKYA